MKQKLFLNQLSGRWLAVVLALLLMPLGILGQITVAGISPDGNGDIQTSDIQGFDGGSYVAHYSNGVLTLQNVRLEGVNGLIVWSGDTDLTIEFSGTNSIDKQGYTTDVLTPIKSTTGHNLILRAANNSTNAKLYFGCYDLEGKNDLSGVELISGFSQVVATGLETNDDNGTHSKTITYRVPATSYNLWLGGVQVTSDNASNVLGDNGTPTVVFDAATNTLTLNNLSDESFKANDNPYVVNGLGNLTIHLVGENFVWFASQFLAKSGTDGDNYNVTFTTDEENRGSLGLRSGTSDWCTGHTVVYNNGLAWIDQGYDNDYHTYKMLIGVEEYDLTVSGVQVTSANASNVLGDDETPTIVFDAATSTLTLNEVYLTVNEGDAIVSGLDDLTIFLVGENSITSYGSTTYAFSKSSEVSEATITFTTDATSNGSLTIAKLEEYLFGDGVTPVYDNVSIKHNGDYPTISSSCGISVGGVAVTEINKSNVLGDGKVSYNATTHTLTLNNATIAPNDEVAGISFEYDVDLTIALIGNNSIRGGEGCTAISKIYGVETPHLYFVKADANQHFSLNIIAQDENDLFEGFTPDYGEDFFVTDEEDDGTFTRTISSTMFGGTGSAAEPFLIKTADDLKNFATYIRESVIPNTSFVKLSDDIGENGLDCSTLEFEPIGYGSTYFLGTFDGNNKTIKNLTVNDNAGDCVGFVRILGEGGVIKDLTLDNLTLSGGNSSSNSIGGLVGYLNGGTINNCTVQNSNISCKKDSETTSNNSQNPTVGGIAGQSVAGTITNCTLLNSAVNAETFDTRNSSANANAGGIAGRANSGSISGCQVKGTTTVLASYGEYSATVSAGALFGGLGQAELSGNTYEYTVTTTTKEYDLGKQQLVTNTNTDYYHRGIGGKEDGSTDVDGAVMYTQTVTVPGETPQASVTAEQDTYYSTAMISDALAYLVAPRQTVMLNVTSGEGYVINTFTATNTTTGIEIEAGSEEDNPRQYTFTMPDAPVTVAVTAAAAYGVTVAGVEVTELNYTDVLGDGKVSFTLPTQAVEPQTESTPATLTLNGATINGNIVSSLTTDLYIHLLGSNVINAGKESAFVSTTASSTQTLVFTTNATTPGQLLIKTSSNGYKENFSDAFGDGLTLAAASGKRLIAAAPTMTPTEGLYWTDQQFTVSGPSGSTLYYKNNINSEETAYTEPFTLDAGNYSLCAMRKVTEDETEFSLYGSSIGYVVHAKPAFSQQTGTYVGQQNITLTGLPNMTEGQEDYPQVWYYLGENADDSVRVYTTTQKIAVSESTKVSVYILDENSGKVCKSAKVEAEYTILSDMADAYVEAVPDATYTGSAIVPTVVVRANEKSEDNLTAGEDYTVSYMQGNNSVDEMINVGNYSIVITGKGAYGGSKQVAFTITKAQAEVTTAPVAANELAYTGEAQNLLSAAGIANFGTVVYSLASNGEFTATIPQATEVGDYEVFYKVLGTDNYDGTDAQSVAVTISKAVVTLAAANQSSTYTGAPVTYDETKITITPAALAEDRAISYTVSYNVPDPQNPEQTVLTEEAPTAVGTYGVTISLVDEGERYQAEAAQATLTITAAAATLAVAPQAQQNLVFNATPQELVTAGQTADGTIQYKLSTDENWSTAIPTATNKGTYTVSYKVVGDANHNDTEPVDVEVTISAMTLTSEIVSLNQTGTAAIVYDGEAKTPAVAGYYSTQKTELVEGTDFTVAYTDNTNAGTAKATVTGLGNYTGSVELTFTIGKADFAGVEIAEIADQPYNNGQAIEPAVTVTFNGIEVPASEYSVAYTANTAVGKATVTLTATGQTNFVAGGTASTTFTIINRTLAVGTDVAFADGQTWASYYTTTEDLELPEKVMAYIVTAVSETEATVAPISYVPKDVPVLLENNSTVTTENTDARGNLLAGTTEATAVAGLSGTVYGLHGNRFLKVTSGSIPARRAYLVTGTEVVAPTGAPYLNIIFGDATAIDRVKADAGDGDGQWYTLDGRKLQQKPAKKGLYIKNGRKVVINNK